MLLIHTEQACRTATSKPLHWRCTLLSSSLYTCGQRKGGETYAQGNKQCFIGREIYKKRAAQVLILNHADAFFVFNIVLKLIMTVGLPVLSSVRPSVH